MRNWGALAAVLASLGVSALASEDRPVIRTGQPPPKAAAQPPFRYDPLADLRRPAPGDRLGLDGPFYSSDGVKAALGHLSYDTPLGPPDIADDAWQDRMERLGAYATALARTPRHSTTLLGMRCDLASPLGFACKVPDTDCIALLGLPPIVFCPF